MKIAVHEPWVYEFYDMHEIALLICLFWPEGQEGPSDTYWVLPVLKPGEAAQIADQQRERGLVGLRGVKKHFDPADTIDCEEMCRELRRHKRPEYKPARD